MTNEHFTAEFRMPPLAPLHGSLEQLFDLMDALAVLGAEPAQAPVHPIEGVFLL